MQRLKLLMLLLMGALLALGGAATQAARPAAPVGGPAAHPPQPGKFGQPLEGGHLVPPAPFLTGPPSLPEALDPHWAPNVRANTDTTGPQYAQQEPAIAVNPLNHLNVVAAQKDERRAPAPNTATKEVWIDTSTDGGQTWPVNVPIPMPDTTNPQQSDPVVTFSDNNNVFVTIIGYDQNGSGLNTVLVARSTDGGLTWPTPAVKLDPTLNGSDKEWTAIDLNPASPYYHRLYTTWTNFSAGPQFVEKWSSDFGVTWNPPGGSAYVTVSYGSFDTGQFSMPVVLPNGTVIATWEPGGQIAVGKSTDGGQSFINPNTSAVNVTEVNGVPGAAWRLNTIPSTAASQATSTLVTVWADGRNGKDDIYFSRSTDGGTTWSAAARVAHNAAGSSYQVEPWVAVAPNGRFDVIWYDDRDFPSALNTFNIYASHSTDDGATWTGPDEQASDAATNLNIGIPGGPGWNGAAGDYINLTSANDVAYGDWTDTRSGTNEDIYTAKYTPPAQGTPTSTATGTPPTATRTITPIVATSTSTVVANTPTAVLPTATTGPPSATSAPATATRTSVVPTVTSLAATATNTSLAATATNTSLAATATSTAGVPTTTSTPCTISFSDVHPSDYFYTPVLYLACHGAISGYGDGTFRPFNPATRSQLVKIVVLGFALPLVTPAGSNHTFADVTRNNPFFAVIETAAAMNIVSGYTCGGPGEPCDAQHRPYFRPYVNVTRGQFTKIVVVAKGWALINPPNPHFADVPPGSAFYVFVETAYCHALISGYACGGPGEPCAPLQLPYFRPNTQGTRGQLAKVVYLAILSTNACVEPSPTPTP